MTGVAEQINARAGSGSNAPYAPLSVERERSKRSERSAGSAAGVLAAFLVLSLSVAFWRAEFAVVESYGIPRETASGVTCVLQGLVAFICFVLAARKLRN